MADIYVRSTDGNNADDGSTWALAEADLHTTAWAAGSRIFVSDAHAQSTASAITIASGGTLASPTLIICGDDAAEPPTAVATTGSVTTSVSSGHITITGSCYVYGLTFNTGTGSGALTLSMGSTDGSYQHYKDCVFRLVGFPATGGIGIGGSSAGQEAAVRWENCTARFAAATQKINVTQGRFIWSGGGIESGGTAPTTLVNLVQDGFYVVLSGLDISNAASTLTIFTVTQAPGLAMIRNGKLPASWTGSLGTPTGPGARLEMHNCDDGDTNYRLWVEDYAGSIKSETTIVRSGGASDGTTSLSWKMASSANAGYPLIVLDSPEIVQWNDTTGSAITVTVEVITDNVTLKDDECWLEVQYLGTSGYPLSVFISDCKANVLAGNNPQATSTETWTTTGLTTPTKQKLSVTFTPQEKGFLHAVVKLAKASTTVYVDPLLVVT